MNESHWFGFWIFLSVVWFCDAWMTTQGHNTTVFGFKTENEKRLQNAIIKKIEAEGSKSDT